MTHNLGYETQLLEFWCISTYYYCLLFDFLVTIEAMSTNCDNYESISLRRGEVKYVKLVNDHRWLCSAAYVL